MPLNQYPAGHVIVDGENRPIRFDTAYAVSAMSLDNAICDLLDRHGTGIALLPLSGTSAGAGVFQVESNQTVVALHIQAVNEPRVQLQTDVDILSVKLDEIVIDKDNRRVYAGSAINLNQLNQALANQLGASCKVLGADLTSYTYAQVGATFMTGGMGPQRRYFSDSVCEIAIHNGKALQGVSGDDLKGYAGSYGWTGIVAAVCCDYVELPVNEVAFALPVNNTPDDLARLLAHLSPFTQLQIDAVSRVRSEAGDSMILGLEHITTDSMQPFLDSGETELTAKAAQLKSNCEAAGADGLIFVSAYSPDDIDEFLLSLADDIDADDYSIAGIKLEHTEVFRDPEQMRAVREGIPYAARMQAPKGHFSFKGHTDANIVLNPQCIEEAMRRLWHYNCRYVESVREYFDRTDGVEGEILVYGHLNPVGVDPHNRVTFASDDETVFRRSVRFLDKLKDQFVGNLAQLCEETGCGFSGGEKSAGSEYEMLPGFGDLKNAPPMLAVKVSRHRQQIQAASPLFSWRAMPQYLGHNTNNFGENP